MERQAALDGVPSAAERGATSNREACSRRCDLVGGSLSYRLSSLESFMSSLMVDVTRTHSYTGSGGTLRPFGKYIDGGAEIPACGGDADPIVNAYVYNYATCWFVRVLDVLDDLLDSVVLPRTKM